MGLADGAENGVLIQGGDGAGVDDLYINALGGQLFRGFQGAGNHESHRHQRHILAGTLHIGHADGDGVIGVVNIVGDLLLHLIKLLGLTEEHRVVGADGGLQQALGVIGAGGGDDGEAGSVHEQALHGVGVLTAGTVGGAGGAADHQGQLVLRAVHIAPLGHTVENFREGNQGEVGIHQLHAGPQAGLRRADGAADDGCFRNGGVADPLGAELLQHSPGDAEDVAELGDILAVDQDLPVPAHFFLQRVADGGCVSNFHCVPLLLRHTGCRRSLPASSPGPPRPGGWPRPSRGRNRHASGRPRRQ